MCTNSEPCIACSLLQSSKFTTFTSLFTLLEASQIVQCHCFPNIFLVAVKLWHLSVVVITSSVSCSTHPNSSLPDPSSLAPPPDLHNTTPHQLSLYVARLPFSYKSIFQPRSQNASSLAQMSFGQSS